VRARRQAVASDGDTGIEQNKYRNRQDELSAELPPCHFRVHPALKVNVDELRALTAKDQCYDKKDAPPEAPER
jgi:hypothetical protein